MTHEKIVEYLLNPLHADSAPKAKFFTALGFEAERWEDLATALRRVAEQYQVSKQVESRHGRKYIVDGAIVTPSRSSPQVRTVWIVDHGSQIPRLVTAYPWENER